MLPPFTRRRSDQKLPGDISLEIDLEYPKSLTKRYARDSGAPLVWAKAALKQGRKARSTLRSLVRRGIAEPADLVALADACRVVVAYAKQLREAEIDWLKASNNQGLFEVMLSASDITVHRPWSKTLETLRKWIESDAHPETRDDLALVLDQMHEARTRLYAAWLVVSQIAQHTAWAEQRAEHGTLSDRMVETATSNAHNEQVLADAQERFAALAAGHAAAYSTSAHEAQQIDATFAA
jgi:hypothetical protein